MAKPAWITVNPSSGTGNGTITLTASAFTGRVNRTGTVTVTTNGGKTATVACTQTAKALFITPGANTNVAAAITTSKLTFTTNAKAFKLNPGSGVTVGAVTANKAAVTAASGIYTPASDPGASAQYTVEVTITFTANDTLKAVNKTVEMIDSETSTIKGTATCVQAAAASRVSVNPTSLTFATAGEGKTFSVSSNDSWTVS